MMSPLRCMRECPFKTPNCRRGEITYHFLRSQPAGAPLSELLLPVDAQGQFRRTTVGVGFGACPAGHGDWMLSFARRDATVGRHAGDARNRAWIRPPGRCLPFFDGCGRLVSKTRRSG